MTRAAQRAVGPGEVVNHPGAGTKPAEPHNLEAERSALGAALLDATAADYLADHLCRESFYRKAHQTLFAAIQTLRHQGAAVDLVTLKQQLGGPAVEQVGGPSYITGLVDGLPRGTNVAHYAAILEDLRCRRALGTYARGVLEAVAEGDLSGKALIERADQRLLELQAGHLNGRQGSLADGLPILMEDFEYRVQNRGSLLGLDTGFAGVNELTYGWQAGDQNIIAARPSIGKTTFVLNTARHAARAGARVGIFSLEMRRRQLEYRLLSSASGIPLSRILTGYINDPDWPAINAAVAELAELSIEIDDATNRSAVEMRGICRRWKAERGLDLVIVDYVQLIPGTLERRGASRNEELTDISRRLKTLADEGGFPLLLLSQLSRPDGRAAEARPKLTDLRDSGAIEQDADAVCFLHRKHHKEGGPTEFIVEKQRNGPTGTVMLHLDRDTTTFTDGTEPLPPTPPEEKAAERKVKQQQFFKQRARAGR